MAVRKGVSRRSSEIDPRIVRSYDLRGVVGRELQSADARALGLAYAAVARAQGRDYIVVGRDGRLSSPELEEALVGGLVEGGMRVARMGLAPTPQVHFAIHALGFHGGIMVTGSHNPPEENGFKLVLGTEPVYGRALRDLVATEPAAAPRGEAQRIDLTDQYAAALAAPAAASRPLSVVWDCGNGACAAVIEPLLARLPGRHRVLNGQVDGRFPAHHPDPAVPENLRQLRAAVLEAHADLGIAFDGDGDRIGVIDDSGAILWPDQLLLLLAREVLAESPGAAVVADVKSSRVLFEEIERLGGRPVMAPSGYVLVREAMLREGAPLAGEMSGHILNAACWSATDDALHAAVRTLGAAAELPRGLAAFRGDLPATCATPEIRLPCEEHRKASVVREIAARLTSAGAVMSTIDGVRVASGSGWWLLRASGTESKLTVRCEAADVAGLEALRQELTDQLRLSGVELPAGALQA